MARVPFNLASGRPAVFEMPDMLKLVGGGIDIPNSALGNVLDLIYNGIVPIVNDKMTPEQRAVAKFKSTQRQIKAMYQLAALCLVEPIIAIDRVPKDGELSYRDLGWRDVIEIHAMFQIGGSFYAEPTDDNGSSVGETDAPDGGGVPQGTE